MLSDKFCRESSPCAEVIESFKLVATTPTAPEMMNFLGAFVL